MENGRIMEHLEKQKPEVILDKSDFPFIKDLMVGDKVSLEIDGIVVRERMLADEKIVRTAEITRSKKLIDNRRIT